MRSLCVLLFPLALLQAQQPGDPGARGFKPLWNGSDLAGWHGQQQFNPYELAAMSVEERTKMRAKDDATVAEHWRVERMNVMDRLILRQGVYEFLHEPETPSKVVINEALELGRTFSADESVRFINGILDAVRRTLSRE